MQVLAIDWTESPPESVPFTRTQYMVEAFPYKFYSDSEKAAIECRDRVNGKLWKVQGVRVTPHNIAR